jgi:hypothetical protein
VRVVVHPAADAELAEAVAYYTAIDPVLGQRFYLRGVDATRRKQLFQLPVRLAMGREIGDRPNGINLSVF